ncbi:hypothetical protein FSP39_013918 [Pinctada imbricata]|uniref:DZIP3-like HEPN domain-containing protein n=1 Tax=Pinctada imbricata TaxID=66713 RepID=A0AA88XDS9_PINIB|nr:hypothetical protein FSP39_013918 [Pinctada imbricata]
MATSRSSITCSSTDTERNNFLRLAQGILGPGTVIARDVLQRYITPYLLSQKVNYNLSIGYRLNKEQRNLVTNASSDGYRKFDITLIYYLLRNLVSDINDPSKPKFPNPTRGWGKSPQPLDHSISDDVERLRILRNHILSHASSASLHDSIYQTAWQQLKDIANRMGRELRKDYDKKLEDLESYTMTEAQWKDMFSKIQSIKGISKCFENETNC